jgi:hypothetical protein
MWPAQQLQPLGTGMTWKFFLNPRCIFEQWMTMPGAAS